MNLNENLIQCVNLLYKELCMKKRILYRERFGFKLQLKANGLANDLILQTDGRTELVTEVLRT